MVQVNARMRKTSSILFLYLNAFCTTGGLEKFNRSFIKAFSDLENTSLVDFKAYSMNDITADERYLSRGVGRMFGGKRFQFVLETIFAAASARTVIIGHINLAPVAVLIRLLFPNTKIWLVCHGIEVWRPASYLKRKLLNTADRLLAVSSFTKERIIENHHVPAEKIQVFPNTIDPFFNFPVSFNKPGYLLKRYGISAQDKVILTVSRLTVHEKFKGYDNVIRVLPSLLQKQPNIRYVLCGKYQEAEKERIDKIVVELGLETHVIMPGFVADAELTDHYLLGDVFIMPSKKEGFGIVFIEAMACGLSVIGGNKDGTVDALAGGALGKLIDPDDVTQIEEALYAMLAEQLEKKKIIQEKVVNTFGYQNYSKKLKELLPV